MLPLGGVATLGTAKLVNDYYGLDAFGLFALIASLPLLVPIADLGLGAAVTNASAQLPTQAAQFRAVLATAVKALLITSALVSACVLTAGLTIGWALMLSVDRYGSINSGVTTALTLFALSIPASLGPRILLGRRRNTTVILLQGLAPLTTAAITLVLLAFGVGLGWLLAASTSGILVSNLLCALVASRDKEVREAIRSSISSLDVAKPRILNTAIPTLVISLALPLTFQTHRLVLTHFSSLYETAMYSAVAALAIPAVSVVQASGMSLWPEFARAREDRSDTSVLFIRCVAQSVGIGVAGAVTLLTIGPTIAVWVVGAEFKPPYSLFVWFAVLILIHAFHICGGMFLTDASGLRIQAVTTVVMALVSVPASVHLTPSLGAAGPLIATCSTFALCQAAPCFLVSYRRSQRTAAITVAGQA